MPLPAAAARTLADALAPALARWTTEREREILARGLPLPADLVPFARELGIDDPASLRLEIRPAVPLPVPAPLLRLGRRLGLPLFHPAGMTLGRGISAVGDLPALLRHELVHVHQYQQLGGHLPFMRRYLFECLRHGYAMAPLEVDARGRSAGP